MPVLFSDVCGDIGLCWFACGVWLGVGDVIDIASVLHKRCLWFDGGFCCTWHG